MAQINKPTDYFDTKLWSGASGDLNITGLDFQPDFVWLKSRNTTGADHKLVDVVRGNSKGLKSNETEVESTDVEGIQSFNSDGYTLGDNDGNYNRVGRTYVGWSWLAGGTASSNTDGSITSTVSVNTTAGFSIVSYTGTGANATVGHGLGSAPKVVIVKTRDAARDWTVYHGGISNMASGYIILNASDAFSTAFSTIWNNTNPTSSVFSVGTANTSNNLNSNYIAYCFAEKKGFSKFGSYVGNGTTGVDGAGDGTFIYTGFKPSMIIIKPTSTTGNWQILDNKRPGFNESDNLAPNNNVAENTSNDFVDLVSNGFKLRSGTYSASGVTYIYMAFAEQPLVGTNNIPATAR